MGKGTKRKPVIHLDDSKDKHRQQQGSAKKIKKAKHKVRETTDVFDPKTGTVFSTKPEDTDQQLVEANIRKFIKNLPEGSSSLPIGGDPLLLTSIPPSQPLQQAGTAMATTSASVGTPNSSADTPVTFWQEVTDPKTHHCYYWNPATNEVNWNLPPNAVISNPSDNTDKLSVLLSNSKEPEAGSNEISGYYDHYAKNWYGVDPDTLREQQKTAMVDDSLPTAEEQGEQSVNGKEDDKKNAATKTSMKKNEGASSPKASGKQDPQILRLQLSSLSDELSRKLKYLQVSQEKISDLRLLSVQLETRLADWREGGIASKYLLGKLKETADEVQKFVESSTPSGWQCEWDSASCRYSFNNTATGEKTWEFPIGSSSQSSESEGEDDKNDEPEVAADKETSDNVEEVEMEIQSPESENGASVSSSSKSTAAIPPPPPPPLPPALSSEGGTELEEQPLPATLQPSSQFEQKDFLALASDAHTDSLDPTSTTDSAEEPMQKPYPGPSLTESFLPSPPPSPPPFIPVALTGPTPTSLPMSVDNAITTCSDSTTTSVPTNQPESSFGPQLQQTIIEESEEIEEVEMEDLPSEQELRERLLLKKMSEKSLDSQTGQAVLGSQPASTTEVVTEPPAEQVSQGKKEEPKSSKKGTSGHSPSSSKQSRSSKRSKRHRDDRSDRSNSDDDQDSHNKSSRGRYRSGDRYSDHSDDSDKGRLSRRHGRSRYSDSDSGDDRHTSRRTSRSHRGYYSDEYSDEDRSSRRSSRKHRSRSRDRYDSNRSRDKSSKKMKKDKKKRKHHHSSSEDEHERSRSTTERGRDSRSSKSSSSKESSRRSFTSKDPTRPIPPPLEKSFVPAKYKPKKVREEPDDPNSACLTPNQMQMIHSIANVTGAGYTTVAYPVVDQQYYYPAAFDPSSTAVPYDASAAAAAAAAGVIFTPAEGIQPPLPAEGTTGNEQETHVPVLSPVAAAPEEKPVKSASPEVPSEAEPTPQSDEKDTSQEKDKQTQPPTEQSSSGDDDAMEVEEAVTSAVPTSKEVVNKTEPSPVEKSAEMSLKSPDAASRSLLYTPLSKEKEEIVVEQPKQSPPVAENDESSTAQISKPSSAIEVIVPTSPPHSLEQKEETVEQSETKPLTEPTPASVTTPSTSEAPSREMTQTTPTSTAPASEKTSETSSTATTTISSQAPSTPPATATTPTTSTAYSAYQQAYSGDPNQAYAAYAQAAMASYNNPAMAAYYPYQYGTAMYDPSQYAAAMNYYANYQAAYGAGYGYYQQSGAGNGSGTPQQKK